MSERRVDTGNVFPARVSLEGITPGMELEERVFGPLGRDDIVRYAEASGDDNPIHQDEEYARSSGAPTVFAMGMLPAGYLANALSGWFGGPQHLKRFKVRFTTRVWPGDEIVCTGRVTELEGRVVKLALEVTRRGPSPAGLDLPEEERAIVGEADVELPE
ncbi:MAG: MaoC family dehydratase N-terminal domain-containing protein [Actinomycetota bacterium]|nr:MaoC family dehydratase N-terminal domain-containing protein [Actinomycetota bacterium]